ncbi:MAG: TlpA family protein disulfide reductase [Actinobacteria bacterium]|nr:TlpA family protein disulfide reductase [Actinomycetota bacterium]
MRPGALRALLPAAVLALSAAACGSAAPQLTAPADSLASPSTSEARPPAPVFEVALFDGTSFSLTRHLSRDGRPVVLNLWASWCPPCREEIPRIEAAARRHPQVLFLGVAVQDEPAAAAAAVAELGATYPTGADLDGTLDAAFPSPGLPATFLIAADGTLIGAHFGALTAADIEALVTRYLAG